jgi:succinyl-diaminopimelate desuccinylase
MTDNVVDIATALMRCRSITPEDAGVMDVLQSYLEPLGFQVTRKIFDDPDGQPTENMYARLGTAAPNLCFAGHVDVVPPGNESLWSVPPFAPEVRDGWLYGRGAEDMKGAIAAFVHALQAYGTPGYGSLSLLITGDEEGNAVNGTIKMLEWMREQGEQIDACLVGEPTNPQRIGEMIKIGRRGSISCALKVDGKQGHVAYPDLAKNPLSVLVDTINEMQHHVLDEGTEFFPPSNFEVTTIDVGNPTVNLIPQSAHARFNIRFNDRHTGAEIEAWLREVCDRHLAEREYVLTCHVSGDAFLTRDERLSDALIRAAGEVTGLTPVLSTTGGTSDARFIKDVCPVVEFGTTGMRAHQIDERVEVTALEQLSAIYLKFIENYFAS